MKRYKPMSGNGDKAEAAAHQHFANDIVRGLRKKRLSALMTKPAKKEPEGDQDLGGYDKLREMFDSKK